MRLEKIEITGLNGKSLSQMVLDIYDEFLKAYSELGAVEYDILLPENEEFTKHIEIFLDKVCVWHESVYVSVWIF